MKNYFNQPNSSPTNQIITSENPPNSKESGWVDIKNRNRIGFLTFGLIFLKQFLKEIKQTTICSFFKTPQFVMKICFYTLIYMCMITPFSCSQAVAYELNFSESDSIKTDKKPQYKLRLGTRPIPFLTKNFVLDVVIALNRNNAIVIGLQKKNPLNYRFMVWYYEEAVFKQERMLLSYRRVLAKFNPSNKNYHFLESGLYYGEKNYENKKITYGNNADINTKDFRIHGIQCKIGVGNSKLSGKYKYSLEGYLGLDFQNYKGFTSLVGREEKGRPCPIILKGAQRDEGNMILFLFGFSIFFDAFKF